MMYAEVHGNNQGISKLYRPQDMGFNPQAGPLKFENETALSVGKKAQLSRENRFHEMLFLFWLVCGPLKAENKNAVIVDTTSRSASQFLLHTQWCTHNAQNRFCSRRQKKKQRYLSVKFDLISIEFESTSSSRSCIPQTLQQSVFWFFSQWAPTSCFCATRVYKESYLWTPTPPCFVAIRVWMGSYFRKSISVLFLHHQDARAIWPSKPLTCIVRLHGTYGVCCPDPITSSVRTRLSMHFFHWISLSHWTSLSQSWSSNFMPYYFLNVTIGSLRPMFGDLLWPSLWIISAKSSTATTFCLDAL